MDKKREFSFSVFIVISYIGEKYVILTFIFLVSQNIIGKLVILDKLPNEFLGCVFRSQLSRLSISP